MIALEDCAAWIGRNAGTVFWAVGYGIGVVCAWDALLKKIRDATGTLVWVVFCLGVPWIGAFCYVTFGVDRISRRRRQRIRSQLEDFRRQIRETRRLSRTMGTTLMCPFPALWTLGEYAPTSGNDVRVLVGGHAAYAQMIQ